MYLSNKNPVQQMCNFSLWTTYQEYSTALANLRLTDFHAASGWTQKTFLTQLLVLDSLTDDNSNA